MQEKYQTSNARSKTTRHGILPTMVSSPPQTGQSTGCVRLYGGTSLNKELLQGPDLTNSLVGVLTQFREGPVAMMADIEAMFHQVRDRPPDCDSLRFLWWPDNDLSKEPTEYQMMVHLFGSVSPPTCANFALQKTADNNDEQFDPDTISTVKQNFYMDNCLKSSQTVQVAITTSEQLRILLFISSDEVALNSRSIIESIPDSERSKLVKEIRLGKLPTEHTLGVLWNVKSDTFRFTIVIKSKPFTRRGNLFVVSSVYDRSTWVCSAIRSAGERSPSGFV